MKISFAVSIAVGCLGTEGVAISAITGTNASNIRGRCDQKPQGPSYGDNKCRCVGMDNLKGFYATQVNYHHVQYLAETGASCEAWDNGKHPACQDSVPPQWCSQKWCYVDPCSCNIDELPKATEAGITYQGNPAYWSYATCGGMDFFSQEVEGACVNQKIAADCAKQSKCAWDGKQCAGKEILETCKDSASKDAADFGEEDCRCVGLGGKEVGKAFMHIDDERMVQYPADIGSTCKAWEADVHPDCMKEGDKPSWCSKKWCFVDPCKCKTKAPPKAVMPANKYMRFQGKTAYFSYNTCGNEDSWSASHKGMYCPEQKTKEECSKLSKCAWTGKECLGKALAEICEKQESTGMMGVEAPLPEDLRSSSVIAVPLKSLIAVLGAAIWTK